MGKILITGASGFIGRNFLSHLENINSPLLKDIVLLTGKKMNSKYCEILHEEYSFTRSAFSEIKIDDLETVFHLGGYIPKSNTDANNVSGNTSNISSTLHLLKNLPAIPKRFIFISTVDVYKASNERISEESQTAPSTLYGWSKLYCEKLVLEWCKENNVIPQILRLGHIYGCGEENFKKLIPEVIRKVIADEVPVLFSDGNEKRSFLNIKDCLNAMLASLKLSTYEGPINIASNVALSIKDVVDAIIKASGKKISPEILNKNIPVLNLEFDTSKMNSLLTIEEYSFEKGIREEYLYMSNLEK